MSVAISVGITTIPPIEILTVCTGNIHRSPLAAYLLQRDLTERGFDAHVTSAGLLEDGRPAAEQILELLDARGLDASEHLTRRITPELLGAQDLVLGMARDHVREIILMQPGLNARVFTLKELVRRGTEVGSRGPDESVATWLARAAAGRTPASLLGSSGLDDVADPIGRRFSVFKKTAAEVEGLTADLAELLAPGAR